ncbi:flagellar hook-length control protein FliK [Pseudomonas sp. NA-150]|uniref:flagellar hook-length control protein FliK n=1 Tax=Pseudomonas sp. NA-150 TaxID=3367525 RepID=UPI0037C8B47B
MSLATNPLLQPTPAAKSQPVAASNAVKPAETGKDSTSSFSQVFAKQVDPKPAVSVEPRTKAPKNSADVASNKPKADSKSAADKTTVADNGKSLPANKADKTGKKTVADGSDKKDDDKNAAADDKATTPVVADAAPVDPTLAPALDPSLTQVQPTQPATDPTPPVATVPLPPVDVPPTVLAAVTPPPVATPVSDNKAFDPASDDPLAGLSAVQVALEQNGKSGKSDAPAQASTSTSTTTSKASAATAAGPAQAAVNNLPVALDPQTTDSSNAGAGDKAFKNLIDDGLKDSTVAASDTKVDDFASRIAALSQAVQPKAPVAPAVSPLAQPLAMHQSGWSEGVVDRVMYLSSQNLKSADIQLEPAELGRLDIRVNMAPDQQTQVTFMSSHPAVREALEGQMNKLRDSFTQQGLGQVDVNVSDQSRGWNGQGQNQQQANQSQRSGGGSGVGSGSGDGLDDHAIADVAPVSQPMHIIGTSQVDYYA